MVLFEFSLYKSYGIIIKISRIKKNNFPWIKSGVWSNISVYLNDFFIYLNCNWNIKLYVKYDYNCRWYGHFEFDVEFCK